MDAKEIQKKVMTMQDRHGSIPKAGQDQIEKPSGNQFHVRQAFMSRRHQRKKRMIRQEAPVLSGL